MTVHQNIANYYVQHVDGWLIAQLDACLHCGICAEACPFFLGTGEITHTPVQKLEPLRRAVTQNFSLTGRLFSLIHPNQPSFDQVADWVSEAYFACTVCNRCSLACPMGIDLGALIQLTREGLAAAGMAPPSLADAVHRQKVTGSPLGVTKNLFEDRLQQLREEEGLDIPLDVPDVESLVVFTSVELIKFPANLAATAQVMNASGESWTLSSAGREAVNFATFSGDTPEQIEFVRRITEAALQLRAQRIILTECGHAYDTVRRIATQLYGTPLPFQVENILETMTRFMENGSIHLDRNTLSGQRITFHDACKLQRLGGLIEEPRVILHTIAPDAFIEMTPNREAQLCCGGGGGVIANPEADEIRMKAFLPKVEQLEAITPDVVVTACSTCRLQFLDGNKYYNLDIDVRGITEMVAAALDPRTPKGA
jgi:Fe-S oxidoreductase